MRKKGLLAILIALVLCMGNIACGNTDAANNKNTDKKYSVVCTIFPEYDWVKEVLGDKADNFEMNLLLDNGVDLHSYQPTAADIAKIAQCDLFIYVGGESDEWVEDALAEATNKDMQVINLLEVLGDSVKEEEVVEGMEDEHEHEHGEDEHEEDEHDHEHDEEEHEHDEDEHEHHHEEGEIEYDEHVWLSLKNSQVLVDAIAASVAVIDPDNASVYTGNAKAYNEKLGALDEEYAKAVDAADVKTVLFGDRFPFRYMVDDYGLDYYAAFVGCSAETEASFETVTFLAGKVDELKLGSILVIESSDKKIAETIKQNTADKNQNILVLDSMQSTTSGDIEAGKTYLGIMTDNLEVLKEALKQ
ncbi:MAG: metal ABC transporter substrate-binding protein [Lachnospiraceae bacterium]|nr:metal ABC transporter substrate-binding protein [Lachnospiraceae bacterium]